MPVEINQYIYGNSLVNYAGGSPQSNVPFWLEQFSSAAGNTYSVNGGYGFLRQFADREDPSNEWGFQGVNGAWDSDFNTFDEISFDSVVLTPGNFIQGLAPNEPYPGDTRSPLEASIDVVQDTLADQPNAQFYVYEGWADLGSLYGFPVTETQLADYHAYNMGDYHDWFVDYTQALDDAVPGADVQLIPVASVMAELFTNGPLEGLTLDDLYVDSAPHGTETVYFLSSMITYREVFGEAPPAGFDVPDVIHPLVAQNYDDINTRIGELLGQSDPIEQPEPIVVPNTDPSVENDTAELEQGEVAVIDVLANDSDADGDVLTLQSVGDASGGSTQIVDGRVVYTPDDGFSGADSFSYVVTDGEGGLVEGRVDLVVAEAEPEPEPEPTPEPEPEPIEDPNTAPSAVNDTAELEQGGVAIIDVLANDSDADGDTLSLLSVGFASGGTTEIIDGRVVYTPDEDHLGIDNFSYTVTDNEGGIATGRINLVVTEAENRHPNQSRRLCHL